MRPTRRWRSEQTPVRSARRLCRPRLSLGSSGGPQTAQFIWHSGSGIGRSRAGRSTLLSIVSADSAEPTASSAAHTIMAVLKLLSKAAAE